MMAETRAIAGKKTFSWKSFFLQWEWMLVLLFVAVNIINANLSPYYLDPASLRDATMLFLDKAFIVLPMVLVLVLGDIDISVASTVALSSVVMADLYTRGVPMPAAMLICLAVGTLCGFLNGILIVKFKELSAVIVTLATMIIYRGAAYMILEDQAAGQFPDWFRFLGWGYVGGIPFILIVFIVFAVVFALLLHKTTFGRKVYAIGNNVTASLFSGVQVDKIKIVVFTLAGLMAAVAALFIALYPNVLPSTLDPADSLTVTNAASTPYTLKIMTWVAVVFTPVVLLYQGWTYWVFRKRLRASDIPPPEGLPLSPQPREKEAATR